MSDEPTVSHPTSPRVGSRFGPYLLRRLLGSGGFGEVYEAEDTTMHRVVALKLLASSYTHNPAFRERLFREARTAGRLHDPHVVPIHSCGEIDGQLYIDMRLIDGTDLQGVLDREGPLNPARAVAIVSQIASALDAAHAEQVIHRDVKPANILLGRNDFACLVDFGLANAATDTKLTSEGTTIGSFAYLAPERLTAGQVTPGADTYALACVLYECLTGTIPFPRTEIPALIAAHLTAPVPLPSQQRPGIPPGLDEVVARGMAKNLADRYHSAGELAAAAQRALSTAPPEHAWSPPPTHPAPGPQHWQSAPPRTPAPRPETRRRTALIVGGVAVAACVAAVAIVIGVVGQRTPDQGAAATSAPATASSPPPPASAAATAPALSATQLPVIGSGELRGATADKDGNIYVVDSAPSGAASRVLKLPPGAGAAVELPFHGLTNPRDVAVDGTGNVFVTDWNKGDGLGRVLKLAVGATAPALLPFGLILPNGIAADGAGNVYVAARDSLLELAAGATSPTVLPFANAAFEGIAVDGAGNVYASEAGRVLKLAPGSASPTQLPFASLGAARDIALDARGDIYLIDNYKSMGRLVKLAAGASTSTVLFAPERQDFGGLAVDPAGTVYLTESNRLLRVNTP